MTRGQNAGVTLALLVCTPKGTGHTRHTAFAAHGRIVVCAVAVSGPQCYCGTIYCSLESSALPGGTSETSPGFLVSSPNADTRAIELKVPDFLDKFIGHIAGKNYPNQLRSAVR